MARTIAEAFTFFLLLLVVVAVPATAFGFIGLGKLDLPGSIIATFLIGFIFGNIKQEYAEDNISATIISLLIIGFLSLFLVLDIWQIAVIYIIAYLLGRKLEVREISDPFDTD